LSAANFHPVEPTAGSSGAPVYAAQLTGIVDITRDRKSKICHGAGGDRELEIGKPGLKWGVPGVESYKTFRILVEVEGEGHFHHSSPGRVVAGGCVSLIAA
jgi:hypothetical protein